MNCHLVSLHKIDGLYDIDLAPFRPLGSCDAPSTVALHLSREQRTKAPKSWPHLGVHGEVFSVQVT